MKKILSALLALTMILSLAVVFATGVAAASDENLWTVLTHPNEYLEEYDGDRTSIPGYVYTEDGFRTVTADWPANLPYQHVQTNRMVNLKNGVYMEVRIDDFDYDASDKWFNFNIWDSVGIEPGSIDERFGEGVQTLLRPSNVSSETDEPGKVASIAWYKDRFTAVGSSAIDEYNRTTVEKDGKVYLTFQLEITWDRYDYSVYINGTQAPEKVIEYMNEKFADGMAYIGFAMHSSKVGGSQSCTVTKFGTSRETATTPTGTDYADAINYDNTPADLMDASQVPEGQPGILMTGDRANSHLKATPASQTGGSLISITEDNLIHIYGMKSLVDSGPMYVDNNVSYAVEDFPVLRVLTRNFCSCKMDTHADCLAIESLDAYIMAGDVVYPELKHRYRALDICYYPYLIKNDDDSDNYLTFTLDFDETTETGRFNGVRLDMNGIDLKNAGFNEFDICWVGLFRTEEDADAYTEAYLKALGWEDDDYNPTPNPEPTPESQTVYGVIEEGMQITVPTHGTMYHYYYYEFTPKYTGYYWYYSPDIGWFYDYFKFADIHWNDISMSYSGNSAVAYLEAGEKYYLSSVGYGETFDITVKPLPKKTKYEMQIYENSSVFVEISTPGDYYDLTFVPESTGRYWFSIPSNFDVIMYDEENDQMIRTDYIWSHSSYSGCDGYLFELVEGNKYYFRVKVARMASTGYANATIKKEDEDGSILEPNALLTPDAENSYLSYIEERNPSAGTLYVTEDNILKLVATQNTADFGTWVLDSPINVAENPIIMCVTKNYCSCRMDVHTDCLALESLNCCVAIDGVSKKFNELNICYDAYIIGEDNYLIFWMDLADCDIYSGYIESITMEARGIDMTTEGFNELELCWIGTFDTEDAGRLYADNYLGYTEVFDPVYDYIEGDFFTMEEDDYGYIIPDDPDTPTTDPDDTTDTETETEIETETETETETEAETETNVEIDVGDTTTDTEPEVEPDYEVEEIYDYIELGDVKVVNISNAGNEYYFEFTPDRNGNYYFYSTGDCDVFGEILDEDGNLLAEGESFEGNNFIVRYSFKKGETYYLHTGMNGDDTGIYEIELQKKKPKASSNNAENEEKTEQVTNNAFGCSMSAGFGGVAIVAVAFASVGFASKRRRDEE